VREPPAGSFEVRLPFVVRTLVKIARSAAAVTVSVGLLLALGACSSDSPDDVETSTVATDESSSDGLGGDESTDDASTDDDSTDDDSTDGTSTSDEEVTDDAEDDTDTDDTDGTAPFADVAASCEEFNTLSADLRAVEPGDADGYDDIYLRSEEAKEASPNQELYNLFAVLSLLSLDAGLGEDTTESMATLGQAAFAAAETCTAEGVTLTIS
jgi:hypothetical protein